MPEILTIAKRHRLRVIEDACQSHGARCGERRAGTLADAGCFSFYPGKNLGAFGDAGIVVTDNQECADRVRSLRDHGRADKYVHDTLGFGERLDGLQAAVLAVKLNHLEDWNDRRRRKRSIVSCSPPTPIAPTATAPHVRVSPFVVRVAPARRVPGLKAAGIGARFTICGPHAPAFALGYQRAIFRTASAPPTKCCRCRSIGDPQLSWKRLRLQCELRSRERAGGAKP
jgi:hypothetical protein